jgi:hypothetical protein
MVVLPVTANVPPTVAFPVTVSAGVVMPVVPFKIIVMARPPIRT